MPMRAEAQILFGIGILVLALYGEHLLHHWLPSGETRAINGSYLSWMILGNQHVPKAPTDEYFQELAARRRVGRILIDVGIPISGALLTLSGAALLLSERQRRSRVICR